MALDLAAGPRENARDLVVILEVNENALAAVPNQNVGGLAAAQSQSAIDPAVAPRADVSVPEVAPKENESLWVKEINPENDHVVHQMERTDLVSDHAASLEKDQERSLRKDLVVCQREIERIPERDPEVSPRGNMTALVVDPEAIGIVLGVDQTLNRKDLPIVVPDPLPQGKMVKVMLDPGLNHLAHLLLVRKGQLLHLHALPLPPALGLVLAPQSSRCF